MRRVCNFSFVSTKLFCKFPLWVVCYLLFRSQYHHSCWHNQILIKANIHHRIMNISSWIFSSKMAPCYPEVEVHDQLTRSQLDTNNVWYELDSLERLIDDKQIIMKFLWLSDACWNKYDTRHDIQPQMQQKYLMTWVKTHFILDPTRHLTFFLIIS